MELTTQSLTLSDCGAYWHYAPDMSRIDGIMREHGLSFVLSSCLAALNLNPGRDIEEFLHSTLDHLHDPMLMLNMPKACERLKRAICEREPIRVVTDYDVDGTMSSLILQGVLKICGHTEFSYHIPDRKVEGYGFTTIAAQKAIDDGIKLIVTADIGVRDEAAISLAQQHGIDVIVLDHHIPIGQGVPPSAYAVLCPPQAGCSYPNKSLAACGISLKFAQALLSSHPKYDMILRSLMKLAALGTVADVVSLSDPENRAIVTFGLDSLNYDISKPGLKALLNVSNAQPGTIDSTAISYRIGPRINAAGRLASATLIIDLLHAPNSVIAANLAAKLDAMNLNRQNIQATMVQTAIEQAGDAEAPFIVIALPESPTWHSGVAGIVAGKLKEHFHKPVAIATIDGCMMTGSVRSTPAVHAVKALTSVGHLLTKYGGHAAAAGFSCPVENLEEFRSGLCENAIAQLDGEPEIPMTEITCCLEPEQIETSLFDELLRLEPCGSQNPKPMICIKNAHFSDVRTLKEKHLEARIDNAGIPIRCIWFFAPIARETFASSTHHLVGELQKEIRNGYINYQLCVRDACRSTENVFV